MGYSMIFSLQTNSNQMGKKPRTNDPPVLSFTSFSQRVRCPGILACVTHLLHQTFLCFVLAQQILAGCSFHGPMGVFYPHGSYDPLLPMMLGTFIYVTHFLSINGGYTTVYQSPVLHLPIQVDNGGYTTTCP